MRAIDPNLKTKAEILLETRLTVQLHSVYKKESNLDDAISSLRSQQRTEPQLRNLLHAARSSSNGSTAARIMNEYLEMSYKDKLASPRYNAITNELESTRLVREMFQKTQDVFTGNRSLDILTTPVPHPAISIGTGGITYVGDEMIKARLRTVVEQYQTLRRKRVGAKP